MFSLFPSTFEYIDLNVDLEVEFLDCQNDSDWKKS